SSDLSSLSSLAGSPGSGGNGTSSALMPELLTCWLGDVMLVFRRRSASANTSMIVSARSFLLVKLLSFGMYPIAASSFQKARSGLICKFHIQKFFFSSNLGTLLWTTVVFVILQLKNRGN